MTLKLKQIVNLSLKVSETQMLLMKNTLLGIDITEAID